MFAATYCGHSFLGPAVAGFVEVKNFDFQPPFFAFSRYKIQSMFFVGLFFTSSSSVSLTAVD